MAASSLVPYKHGDTTGSMKVPTWLLLSVGFGALLVLIVASAAALHARMAYVFAQIAEIQQEEQKTREPLDGLRSEIYLTSIIVRDYLLDPSPEASAEERQKLEDLRTRMEKDLAALDQAVRGDGLDERAELREAILSFWKSVEPVFEWTPEERSVRGPTFRRRSVVPYRDVALAAAQRVGNASTRQTLEKQREVIRANQELAAFLNRTTVFALILGLGIAVASIAKTRVLEAAAADHLGQIEEHAAELRKLSQQLTRAQEAERRNLSRELHDQVGQMLTALGMELGNLQEGRFDRDSGFDQHLRDAKRLNQEMLRTVRNISSGLRPSVLDELGLAAALTWQAREFTRRYGVPIDLQIDDNLPDLPDEYRTCIYRIVQESLTNTARHSDAKSIQLSVREGRGRLFLKVQDDGCGFQVKEGRNRGMGLLNIQERAAELGGELQLVSKPGQGTLLRCEIPVPQAGAK
jgi:signal transduction histidine kinase